MSHRMLHNLDFARKALLTAAAAFAIAIPLAVGVFNPSPSRAQSTAASATTPSSVFASVSVRPNESASNQQTRTQIWFSLNDGSFTARGVTLQRLAQMAYHVQDSQVSGGPEWLNTAKFDVDAKLEPAFASAMRQPAPDDRDVGQTALKSLLASQFTLAVHFETRNLDAYDLVPDEGGAKLQASGTEPRMVHLGRGELTSSGAPLDLLTAQLSARLGRPVVDKTGLKGDYAYSLHWTPDPSEDEHLRQAGQPVGPEQPTEANGPSLMAALQEQLGLKLEPKTEPVQALVIDHAEAPSAE